MKKSLLTLLLCLGTWAWGQNPRQIQKLENPQPVPTSPNLLDGDFGDRVPFQGKGQAIPVDAQRQGIPFARQAPQPVFQIPFASPQQKTLGGGDDRNLPLSANGKLLSVDNLEVDFQQPQTMNAGTPPLGGFCRTPVPFVNLDPNAPPPANCPFVVPCDNPTNRDANIPTGATPIKFIKLNWIVVRSTSGGAASNISQTRIDDLMNEVNADFAPFRIQFCADPASFVNDDTYYSLNVGSEDSGLKNTYGTTPNLWVNVYVVGSITNPSAGGYARFPYDPLGGYNIRGGVVLARGNMFVGTHTLAHELGHTFGLYHTFHGVDEVTPCTNCYEDMGLSGQDTEGDWCSDTRPHPTNSNICGDAGTDACTGFAFTGAPVNNHMSYSFCTSQFTPQQAGRMHCMIDSYLNNWTAYGGGTCGNLPPVADFIGTPTLWQAPFNVAYTDLSVPAATITTWTWNFDVTGIGGVTPATWTGGPGVGDNPPAVEYTICDTSYTVSLMVSNANGSDTETKTNYIAATCPAGDCDTLDQHWTTPVSTPSVYSFAASDYVTGVPAPTLQGGPGTLPIGFYEQYITPNPGSSTVGGVKVGLGNYLDPDSNTVIQIVVYNCDNTGFPVGGPIGFNAGINPGADLGVPSTGFFDEYWLPIGCDVVIDSPSFLVGVEVFPGNASDELVVISSGAGQGQALGLNYTSTNGFGYINYNTFVGIDFDLDIVPFMGPWPTEFFITGLGALQACDTTLVLVVDTALYHPCMTSVEVNSSKLGSLTDSTLAAVDSLYLLYTEPGPDTLSFTTVNSCGRIDVVTYYLNYPFDTTPGPVDFSMNLTNPICAGDPITFTGTPGGGALYTWDFGDGSPGSGNPTSHTYTVPGTYYVGLTVTNPTGCEASETKLDYVEIIDCSVNAPVADFEAIPDSVCLGDPISFNDLSLAAPDPATDWYWAFDDGTFSLNQNPSHTYGSAGTYDVMLIASNSGGNDTIYRTVVVIGAPCTLPVGTQLSAFPYGGQVKLDWEMSELRSDMGFEVLRSLDGQAYELIGELPLKSTAPSLRHQFEDAEPVWGEKMYYRIRCVSANGDITYSNVATVMMEANAADWLQVYPVPAHSGQSLNIQAYLENEGDLQFRLVDLRGRVLAESMLEGQIGLVHHEVSLEGLAAGSYFLQVHSERGLETKQVIVR